MERQTLQNGERQKQTFLKGAMVMSMSMIVVKVIGMIYKIMLGQFLDGVGYGMFTLAYNFYDPLFMLATGGFPIAISRLVSKSVAENRFRDVKKLHKISIPIFILTGTVCCALMIIFSETYADLVHNNDVKYAIRVLAPTIVFGCLMSIYRGYFEGMRNMVPTAVSEVMEAAGKLILGLSAAAVVSTMGTNEFMASGTVFGTPYADAVAAESAIMIYTVCAALLGIVAGALMGFIFLFFRYRIKGCDVTRRQLYYSEPARSGKEITKELVKTAIPIGVNSLVLSISSMIDSTLIQIRIDDLTNTNRELMQNLYPLVEKHVFDDGIFQTYLNGCYGYALTLMMLVTALTQAFGSSALPSLTSAWTRGDREEIKDNIEMILKLTLCVALPAGLALSMLSWPLLNLLYGNGNLSVEVDIASKILQILGISVIFIATSTPICSMLQAVGRVDLPLKLMSIAMVVKISLNYTLVGIPTINIQGAAVGSLVAYLFVVVVGLYFLCKETKIVPDFVHVLIKPLIGALICVTIGLCAYNLLSTGIFAKISIIITAVFTVIIYFVALLLLRVVSKREICMLPKGEKIAKLLEKAHILR